MEEKRMEAYTDFAQVYDTFMDETPYEEWCDYLTGLLSQYGIRGKETDGENQPSGTEKQSLLERNLRQEKRTVLDLGCGTGTLTELLSQRGYEMIGIDQSEEMLQIAALKRELSGSEILYLCQDMRELELYGTVGAVISVCDAVNYLLEEEELERTFRLVNNYLYPDGIFIFDFNTVYKYETIIGDATIAEAREECSFIWENTYYEEEQINEYDLTVFVKEQGDSYRRFQETHLQRGYELEQMRRIVERAGLIFLQAVDADTHTEVTGESERIYVIARKGCKENTTAEL